MPHEYKVVPAPRRGQKAKGVKTPEDRFALALTEAINRMAAEGWEYIRAETLPAEEKTGWTGKLLETVQHVLVFRRERSLAAPIPAAAPAEAEPALRLAARREAPEPVMLRPLGPARGEDA